MQMLGIFVEDVPRIRVSGHPESSQRTSRLSGEIRPNPGCRDEGCRLWARELEKHPKGKGSLSARPWSASIVHLQLQGTILVVPVMWLFVLTGQGS